MPRGGTRGRRIAPSAVARGTRVRTTEPGRLHRLPGRMNRTRRLRDLRAGVPRATRGCVILAERLDVDAVDFPEGGPLEPPIQLPFLDRGFATMPASLAAVRRRRAIDRGRGRADRPAFLAERLEGSPSRGIGVAGPVLVDDRPDFFRARSQIADEGLHLRVAIRVRGRNNPDAGREPIQHPAEILPEMFDPVRVATERIRDIDEPAAGVLPPVLFRELGHLGFLRLPLVLRVQDETLNRVPTQVSETSSQELGECDLASEPPHMLESADAQASVDDEVPLLADVRFRIDEEVIVPVRQRVPPRRTTAEGPKGLRARGSRAT